MPNQDTRLPLGQQSSYSDGPYLAKVVSVLDSTYMGILEVRLLRESGNDPDVESQLLQVRYLSPFYGVTNIDHVGVEPNDYNNTQKSYGFWMVPPDVGNIVMVIFVEGDARKGYWIGCVPDEKMNFMTPGYASTKYVIDDTKNEDLKKVERLPTAEYNKKAQENINVPNHYMKPAHPFQNVLKDQGLTLDDTRGITTSSARREIPSSVFGISTPGPVDKREGAKQGSVGKPGSAVKNAFVSRLGGSSFVMDDGDDKFIRKTSPETGGPVYVALEHGETGGNAAIPHNELIRLRTRTGHQILMHNSEDLIYIGNSRGTTWIELTSNGKIDIYANDSISIHTENDLNVTADRDINFTAVRNINMMAGGDTKITSGSNTNIKSGKNHVETAAKIDMNGPAAATASVPSRVPKHEPWRGHENLEPSKFTKDKTGAVEKAVIFNDNWSYKEEYKPETFQKYSTSIDTFEKAKPPEEKQE